MADRSRLGVRRPAPAPAELLTSLSGWYRPGGHRLTFFATLAELQELIDTGLPEVFGPWHLTGADLVPVPEQPDRYHQRPWAASGVELSSAAKAPNSRSRINLFVWSERLTRGLPPLEPGTDYEGLCSFNGFLLLQPGDWAGDAIHETSLCIVDRIVNEEADRERRYPEYLQVFNRLRRLVRKRLIAPGVLTTPDGSEHLIPQMKWTAGAMAAYAAGARFVAQNRPWRPLESMSPSS